MYNYLKGRNEEVKKLHAIYSSEIPEFLKNFLECHSMKRLNGIGQHCGTEYVKIPMFNYKYFYSRLDHSVGVALILWNFTKNKKQTIAGLLHDISSTVFAHVGDFLKKDYLNQEKTELNTHDIIKNTPAISQLLTVNNLNIGEVSNYKHYPIADNKSPGLSSDRLECALHYPLIRGEWTLNDVAEVYNNIAILKNENGMDELGLEDIKFAEKLSLISIVNGKIDSSSEDKLCMQLLADILEIMINEKLICEQDLYSMTEEQIIELMESGTSGRVKNAWNFYKNLTQVKISNMSIYDRYCISLEVKKRYIDPLVKTSTGVYRASEISQIVKSELKNFKDEKLWDFVYIDYKL